MSNPLEVRVGYNGQEVEQGLPRLGSVLGNFSKKLIETRDEITSLNAWMETLGRTWNTAFDGLEKFYSAAKQGADLAEARQQFQAYAASVGKYSESIIEASRRAAGGQVSDAELITNTMAAMRQNVSRDQNELAKLWEIAEVKSDQFGGSISENFRKITDAIATGNGKALISLGLLPEAFGKASSQGALLEKRGITLSSVLKQFGEDTDVAAGAGDSAADSFNRMEASWKNLKDGASELLSVVFLPVVVALEKIITKANEARKALANILPSNNATNPFLGKSSQELNSLRLQAQQQLDSLIPEPTIPGVPPARRNTSASMNPGADIGALKSQLALIDAALKAEKELSDTIRNNDLWNEYDERIRGIATSHGKAGKAAKAHKEQVRDLFEQYDSLRKAADDIAGDPRWQAGMSAFVGGFSFDVVGVVEEAKRLNEEFEKLADASMDIADEWGDIAGEIEKAFDEGDEGLDKAVEEFGDRAGKTIREPIAINVADALAAGINEAGNSGRIENFGKAFGDSVRRQLFNALSQSMTGGIGNVIGYVGGSGTVYGAGSSGGTTASGGGSGLLGNLFNVGPMMKGGAFQFGNFTQMLGTSAAIGFVANRLFGQGGLFGGRVVHGAEAINQAADINTQVTQAREQRGQYLGMPGVSDSTYAGLRDLQFADAGYTWSNSGDGIFSKKTKTYALDSAAAQASLAKYAELIAKATAESAAREFEKQFAALDNPSKALAMTLEDLESVIKRGTDANGTVYTDTAKQAQLQLMQIQAQQKSAATARAGDWFSFMLQNPLALGSGTYDPFGSFWGKNQESISSFGTRKYKSPAVFDPEAKLTLGGNTLQGTDISTWLDQMSMTGGLKDQYKKAFDMQSQSMALDPDQQSSYLSARSDMLKEQIESAQSLSDMAEAKIADLTLTTEERTAAFQQFQEAQQSYYAAKLEALTIEQQQQAKIKAKQDELKNDRIADALTFLGEVRERGGQQVLVLAGGSPDTLARLKQIRDGTDSEGAAVIQQIIDGISGSSNPALRL